MRNKIVMAAAEEMIARGLKFTMGDLAAKLHVSKSSLYEYFPSKEAIVNGVLEMALDDMRRLDDAIYDDPKLSLAEKLRALFEVVPTVFGPINNRRLFDDLRLHHPDGEKMIAAFKEEQFRRQSALIAEGVANQSIRRVNMQVLQQLMVSATNDLFTYRFLADSNMTIADALAALADIIVFGLMPQNERQSLAHDKKLAEADTYVDKISS